MEKKENNSYRLTPTSPLHPGYDSVSLQKLEIVFVPNHCAGCCGRGSLFSWNHCIITDEMFVGGKNMSNNIPLMLA